MKKYYHTLFLHKIQQKARIFLLKNLVAFCSNIMYFVDRFVTISYGRMEQQSNKGG